MPGLASKKKDLYLGKCLGDLHKLSEIKQLGNNVTIIVKSADKVFRDAESFDTQGDEERAFVMFLKYFNILKQVKSKADYKKQTEYFDNLLGKKNQLKAIERAEKLSDSLKERYDFREAETVAKKLAALEAKESAKESVENNDHESKSKSVVEPKVVESPPPGLVTCTQLCTMLRDSNTKLTVMDVRTAEDFASSHISHTNCISVPEEILLPGSTVNHIQSKLPSESQEQWSQRKHADHIILLDWKSTFDSVTVGSPLKTLKDALFKYDLTTIIKSEPLVLEGGYEQWLHFYPTMTTNAHVARPSDGLKPKAPSPTITLDFDYPDLDENLQKKKTMIPTQPDAVMPNPFFPSVPSMDGTSQLPQSAMPSFDRSLKPSRPVGISPAAPGPVNSSHDMSETKPDIGNQQQTLGTTLYPSVVNNTVPNNMRPDKNVNVVNDSSKIDESKGLNMVKNDLASDLSKSVVNRQRKETELKDFQVSRDNTLKEDQLRVEETEKRLRDLEQMKKKEEKDVADLMRMKRKLKEEIEEQRKQQDNHRMRLAVEEEERKKAVEIARVEEEEKKQRMMDVERMRDERKRLEQQRDFERRKAEENERQRLIEEEEEERAFEAKMALQRQEKERELENLKEAEAVRHKEEAEKMAEKEREEEERKQQQQLLLESKKREAEEAERLQKEKVEERKKEEKDRQAKIRELEQKRQEEEVKKQEALERQRQETQARLAKEKAEREKMEQKRLDKERQAALVAKAVSPPSKVVPSSHLPTGWEKRLDRDTNRYFYIDHNLGETHWTPPTITNSAKGGDTFKVRLKEEPSVSSSRGMSRSHSSPDIMKQLAEEEEKAKRAVPSFNRGNKPLPSVSAASSKHTAYALRKRDLNPVFGNVGAALTGLRNLGNTCYMNSTVQCLSNTSPLVSYLLNDDYLQDINRDSSTGMHGEVVDDFAVVIKALWSQQYRSITPRDLKNTVGKYNPMFAGYQQQDSQEFLTFLLDGLHEGLNEIKTKPQIPEQSNDNLLDREAAAIAWKHHKMLHQSIIVELFQGQLKSTLMCRTCGKKSVTFQAFMFLSLPIPTSSRSCTLKDCIREFLKPEMMTGSSRWKCPCCKVERDSEKKIDIWKLPHILLIGLNRFYSEGMWMQKKTTYVDFPLTDLDLSGHIAGIPPRNPYSLYGTSNHYGTMEGGHYTAFCRNPVSKKWFTFDDQDVYEMSSSNVKSSAAFVLYYTAIDLPPPKYKPHL